MGLVSLSHLPLLIPPNTVLHPRVGSAQPQRPTWSPGSPTAAEVAAQVQTGVRQPPCHQTEVCVPDASKGQTQNVSVWSRESLVIEQVPAEKVGDLAVPAAHPARWPGQGSLGGHGYRKCCWAVPTGGPRNLAVCGKGGQHRPADPWVPRGLQGSSSRQHSHGLIPVLPLCGQGSAVSLSSFFLGALNSLWREEF